MSRQHGLVRAICICPSNHKPIYIAGQKRKYRLCYKDGSIFIFSLNDCIMARVTGSRDLPWNSKHPIRCDNFHNFQDVVLLMSHPHLLSDLTHWVIISNTSGETLSSIPPCVRITHPQGPDPWLSCKYYRSFDWKWANDSGKLKIYPFGYGAWDRVFLISHQKI